MARGAESPAAVVLLSGGLDSVTVLAQAIRDGRAAHALSLAYGQRHAAELACARRQAKRLGAAAHEVVALDDLGRLVAGATSLVRGSEIPVPKDDTSGAGIPSTYVPARNTVFLAYALSWAEALGAREIWIGVNALDYSGYPDCRPAFIEAFEVLANLATRAGVEASAANGDAARLRVVAPLQHLHKHDIIARGIALGVDYADTVSCYDPDPSSGAGCGRCDSCTLRRRGFEQAGVRDPTRYR